MYVRVSDGLVEEVRLDIFTSHPGFSRHSWRAGPAPSYPASPPEYAGYARSLTRPAHARPLRTPAESVSTGRWPTCAGCRTAGNGSAATRRTATCRTRPTSWVIREWSRWLPTGKSWHADWPCGGPEARSWSSRAARPSIRVNVRVGGFYRVPPPASLPRWTRWTPCSGVSDFDFPDFNCDHELLSPRQPGRYPIEQGTLVSTGGLAFAAAEFEQHVIEEQVPHSTALHAVEAADLGTGPGPGPGLSPPVAAAAAALAAGCWPMYGRCNSRSLSRAGGPTATTRWPLSGGPAA